MILWSVYCTPARSSAMLLHSSPQKSEVPSDYDKHDPEQKQIYRFVRTLFSAAQLTAECAIVTLVREAAFGSLHHTELPSALSSTSVWQWLKPKIVLHDFFLWPSLTLVLFFEGCWLKAAHTHSAGLLRHLVKIRHVQSLWQPWVWWTERQRTTSADMLTHSHPQKKHWLMHTHSKMLPRTHT